MAEVDIMTTTGLLKHGSSPPFERHNSQHSAIDTTGNTTIHFALQRVSTVPPPACTTRNNAI